MNSTTREIWLHITSGQGPVECTWAVVKVLEKIMAEAAENGLRARAIEAEPAERGTLRSALISVSGDDRPASFCEFLARHCAMDRAQPVSSAVQAQELVCWSRSL